MPVIIRRRSWRLRRPDALLAFVASTALLAGTPVRATPGLPDGVLAALGRAARASAGGHSRAEARALIDAAEESANPVLASRATLVAYSHRHFRTAHTAALLWRTLAPHDPQAVSFLFLTDFTLGRNRQGLRRMAELLPPGAPWIGEDMMATLLIRRLPHILDLRIAQLWHRRHPHASGPRYLLGLVALRIGMSGTARLMAHELAGRKLTLEHRLRVGELASQALVYGGRPRRGLKKARALLESEPKSLPLAVNLISLELVSGHNRKAHALALRWRRIHPHNGALFLALALADLHRNHPRRARAWLTRRLSPLRRACASPGAGDPPPRSALAHGTSSRPRRPACAAACSQDLSSRPRRDVRSRPCGHGDREGGSRLPSPPHSGEALSRKCLDPQRGGVLSRPAYGAPLACPTRHRPCARPRSRRSPDPRQPRLGVLPAEPLSSGVGSFPAGLRARPLAHDRAPLRTRALAHRSQSTGARALVAGLQAPPARPRPCRDAGPSRWFLRGAAPSRSADGTPPACGLRSSASRCPPPRSASSASEFHGARMARRSDRLRTRWDPSPELEDGARTHRASRERFAWNRGISPRRPARGLVRAHHPPRTATDPSSWALSQALAGRRRPDRERALLDLRSPGSRTSLLHPLRPAPARAPHPPGGLERALPSLHRPGRARASRPPASHAPRSSPETSRRPLDDRRHARGPEHALREPAGRGLSGVKARGARTPLDFGPADRGAPAFGRRTRDGWDRSPPPHLAPPSTARAI
jgi:hypothetical protein